MKNILKKLVDWVPIVLAAFAGVFATIKSSKSKKLNNKNSTMSSYEDMYNRMLTYISEAEKMGELFRSALKGDTGTWKLNNVLKDLKLYALTMKYDFDEQYWTDEINSAVAFTKTVNSKSENTDCTKNEKNKNQGEIMR